jgi:hypothetical protein
MATTGNRCILHLLPGLLRELTHAVGQQQRQVFGSLLDELAPLKSLAGDLPRPGVTLHPLILPHPGSGDPLILHDLSVASGRRKTRLSRDRQASQRQEESIMQIVITIDDNEDEPVKVDLMNKLWVDVQTAVKGRFNVDHDGGGELSRRANDEFDKWGKIRWK